MVDTTAGRHNGDPPSGDPADARYETGCQARAGHKKPRGVRPQKPNSGVRQSIHHILLITDAGAAGLSEPAGADHGSPDTGSENVTMRPVAWLRASDDVSLRWAPTVRMSTPCCAI